MAWASIKNDKVVAVAFDKTQLTTQFFSNFIEIADSVCQDILSGKRPLSCIDINGNVPITELDYVEEYKNYINYLKSYPCMMSHTDKDAMVTLAKLIPENGIAVEIGSRIGGSAKIILNHAQKSIQLYCIDSEWTQTDSSNTIIDDYAMEPLRKSHPEILNFDSTYDYTKHLLKDYNNVTLMPGWSPYDFQEWNTLVDFVFEDSSHVNPQLKENLDFWWSKLKYGGIMAGHDYSNSWPDVVKEVHVLAERNNCRLNVIGNVWWMVKEFNVENMLSGYGKYLYLPRWKYHLFNKVDKNLLLNRHFFIWDWRHKFGHEIVDSFPWEEFNKCRESHPYDRMSIIFDNSMEAPDYYNHLKPLCDQLIESGILPKDILFWSAIEEPDNIPISNIDTKNGYVIGVSKVIPEYDHDTQYHFVMLAKNPRPMRLMIADQILSRQLDIYGNLSCGSSQWPYDYDTCPYLSDSNRHKFPILLDGIVPQDDNKQYDVSDERITKAAINVICETSQDQCLDGVTLWIKPFITEKTSKAFLLCQFPLMVSVPGMVDKLRRDGFDMFDDIIDHSYDYEQDPWRRVEMVAEQLEKLCKIENVKEFRSLYWDRLLENRRLLIDLFHDIENINCMQIEQWLRDTQ